MKVNGDVAIKAERATVGLRSVKSHNCQSQPSSATSHPVLPNLRFSAQVREMFENEQKGRSKEKYILTMPSVFGGSNLNF